MATVDSPSLRMVIVEDDKFMQSILSKYFSHSFQLEVFPMELKRWRIYRKGIFLI